MQVDRPGSAGPPASPSSASPPARPASIAPEVWGEAARPTPRQLLFDVITAAGFGLVATGFQSQQYGWVAATSAVLLALALAIRRVWLPGMVALAVAAAVIQVASSQIGVVGDVAYGPLAFTLGAHPRDRVRQLGLVCVAVATVVAGIWATVHRLVDNPNGAAAGVAGVAMAAMCAVVVGGGWVTGYLRWQRRQAVQARVDASLQSVEQRRLLDLVEQEQERGRIAADMHDVVAHSWAVVAAQADGARYQLRTDPARAEAALLVIGDTARSAMTDVRRLLTELRDGDTDGTGLDLERTDVLVSRMRASGMDLVIRRTGSPTDDGLVDLTARRVLAESLTNALKHGDLSRPVLVDEQWQGGYRLRVENATDGASPTDQQEGHGLLGMAERVGLAGGTISAGPQHDGWVVEVAIPAAPGPSPSGVPS